MAYVYIFCLPLSAMSHMDEILEQMQQTTPQGVWHFERDDAGLMTYMRSGADEAETCSDVLSVINRAYQTGLKFDPSARGSVFYSMTYGPGGTTYAELQEDSGFHLPYMAS